MVAVARHGAGARLSSRGACGDGKRRGRRAPRRVGGRSASVRFGSPAERLDPPDRREASARSDPFALGRDGPPVEREAVRAMFPARPLPRHGPRGRARPSLTRCSPCSPRGSSRFRSTARSGRRRSRPARALRSRPDRRGRSLDPTGERVPASEALASAGIEPLTLTAKEGLALINHPGRHPRHAAARSPRPGPAAHGRRHRRDVHGGLLGTDRAFAADLVAMRPQPGQALSAANLTRLLAGFSDRREKPPSRRPACPGRVLGALRPAGEPEPRATPGRTWRPSPRRAPARPSTTRSCCPTAGWSRCRTSTAPVALGCDFLAIAAAVERDRRGARPDARPRRLPTGCRRSSPRTPG